MTITAQVIPVQADDADLRRMIDELDLDLQSRYPIEAINGLDFEDPRTPQIVFAVAYADGQPVGCGAIRPLDEESTELKRFYVRSEVRGSGIAKLLLSYLEERAYERGFSSIKLETGERQPEAIRFYEKNGYALIPLFGQYVGEEFSICYEKRIR